MERMLTKATRLLGAIALLVACGYVVAADAQETPQPQPNIGLTVTETLNRLAPTSSSRDDLREIPPPRNDKLSDSVRITVSVGNGPCLPGEDGWVTSRSGRRVRTR